MARPYKLDHFTKGTGASVAPLDDERQQKRPEPKLNTERLPAEGRGGKRSGAGERRALTPLPPGHVRKKATGEIGKVRSVDPRAGTAVVHWLKHGQTSTVPLTAITRR